MVCVYLMVLSFTSLWSSAFSLFLTITSLSCSSHALLFPILLTLSDQPYLLGHQDSQCHQETLSVSCTFPLKKSLIFSLWISECEVTVLFFRGTHSLLAPCLLCLPFAQSNTIHRSLRSVLCFSFSFDFFPSGRKPIQGALIQ